MVKRKLYFFIVINMILFCVGCNTNETTINESTINESIEFVWEYATNHSEGFTLNIQTQQPVTEGISVSYYATQNSFGKESLFGVVEHALDHESIVGGWLNESDSLYYFDSDKVFPDTALDEAIEFAVENEQYAVYDITKDSVIWVSEYVE